jgi:lipopolysaccharide export system permease protein
MISIIDRYVSRELLATWLVVTLVLMLILISGTLAQLLSKAAAGALPGDAVPIMLAITAARYLILLIPLSLFLAVLLSFGRLYKDNEMAVLGACGIGMPRLYRPLLVVVVPITLFMFAMTLYVMPWVAKQSQLFKAEIESRSELSGLAAGQFNQSKDGDTVLFLERQTRDGYFMSNVFMHQKDEDKTQVETAEHARRFTDEQGRKFILFHNGQYYQGVPGSADYQIIRYENHGIYVKDSTLVKPVGHRDTLTLMELWGSDINWQRAELQWRMSIPITTFLLAVLALPLSHTTPRKGRYANLALAILIYLMYSNLLGVGETWVERDKSPVWLGMWWVHGFAMLLILFLWLRRTGGAVQFFRRYVHK